MKKPYWKNAQFWICPRHLPSARFPATVAACWFAGCSSQRPPLKEESEAPTKPKKIPASSSSTKPKQTLKAQSKSKSKDKIKQELAKAVEQEASKSPPKSEQSQKMCAWVKCNKGPNGTRNVAGKRSKYCSRDCSNRNARANYNSRASKTKKK